MGGGGRGGEWYLEKRGSRKPLAPSRNPGSVFDKSEVSLYLFFFLWGWGGGGAWRLRVSAFYTEGYRIFGLVVSCHFFKLLLLVEL